jgi:hypothetical protein
MICHSTLIHQLLLKPQKRISSLVLYLPITSDWLFLPHKSHFTEKSVKNIGQNTTGIFWIAAAAMAVIANRNHAKLASRKSYSPIV